MAVDPTHVYWTDTVTSSNGPVGAVYKANLDGTAPLIISAGSYSPAGVAVGAGHISTRPGSREAQAAIWEANLDGTDPQIMVPRAEFPIRGVAVSTSHLYWANNP